MPSESRLISFSNAEAIDALAEYCATSERELPPGGIKRLVFSNDAEVKVTAEFNGDAPSITFYQNETAAALILYCNRLGIPIARRALKSLQVAQDAISLQLAMRTSPDHAAERPGSRARAPVRAPKAPKRATK
jgi:hypothetical protein